MNSLELPQAQNLDEPETKLPQAAKPKSRLLAERMMNEVSLLNATQGQNLDLLIQRIEAFRKELNSSEEALIQEILDHKAFLQKEELRLHQRIEDHILLIQEGEKTNEVISGAFKEMRERILPPEKANGENR